MKRSKAIVVFPGVTIQDGIRGGRPCVMGTGIPTDAIASRFSAGEIIGDLCDDFGLDLIPLQSALRWHCLSRDQRRRRIQKAKAK